MRVSTAAIYLHLRNVSCITIIYITKYITIYNI